MPVRKSLDGWKQSKLRLDFDVLISLAQPSASIEERIQWLWELFYWIRTRPDSPEASKIPALRLKHLLAFLKRNPQDRLRVSQTLKSILNDISVVDLLSSVGMPSEDGFISEFLDRIQQRFLPRSSVQRDLGEVFVDLFPEARDLEWLAALDQESLQDIGELFSADENGSQTPGVSWVKLNRDLEDAFLYLSGQIRVLGLLPQMRARTRAKALRESPFFHLSYLSHDYLQQRSQESEERLRQGMSLCLDEIYQIETHLNQNGVSLPIVYRIEKIQLLLARQETLLKILSEKNLSLEFILKFVVLLAKEAQERKSLRSLANANLSLLARKIAERSAEAGDHYIARSSKEYWSMHAKALGGGALTAFTAIFKFLIEGLAISYFGKGLFASLNYAFSFVGIQFLGFSLATKQPAMTAAALASKLKHLGREASAMKDLVDEIVCLIRSQAAAVLGNLGAVVPAALAIHLCLYSLGWGASLTPREAAEILSKHSILGPSLFYAAFTGFLLWLSSVIAGWIDNWSVYHRLPESLSQNRRLRFWLGPKRAESLGAFWSKHSQGIAGNVSLGFLLGMSPKLLAFFGLPIDVRHVTLSMASITYAAASLGLGALANWSLWLAFLGVLLIGVVNVLSAFSLSFIVALWAQNLKAPQRDAVYGALLARFKQSPLSFVFPLRQNTKPEF